MRILMYFGCGYLNRYRPETGLNGVYRLICSIFLLISNLLRSSDVGPAFYYYTRVFARYEDGFHVHWALYLCSLSLLSWRRPASRDAVGLRVFRARLRCFAGINYSWA